MASLTVEELRGIVASPAGQYTSEAIETARRELETRPAETPEGSSHLETPALSWWDSVPRAVRAALGYNSLVAAVSMIALVMFLYETSPVSGGLTGNTVMLVTMAATVAVAMVTWTVVVGILKEARFVRRLLILELVAVLAYGGWEAISRPRWTAAVLPVLAFAWLWRFLRDQSVNSYYDRLASRSAIF